MLEKKIQKKLGFSLLELLIYVSILSIIVVVISNTFISLSKGNGQSKAKSEVNSSIRFANELIKQDLKNASLVSVPVSGGTSNTLTLTRNGEIIVYDTLDGVLRRQEATNPPVNVTNPNVIVTALTFVRIENTNLVFNKTNVSIKVNMTFRYNSTNPDWFYYTSLQTTVNLY